MTRVKRTLMNLESPVPDWQRHRFAWRVGSIPAFSSLWITVLRFAMLNRPKFESLKADLHGDVEGLRKAIHYRSSLAWPEHESIDLRAFAHMLGEPIEAFLWSSVGDFPIGLQALFKPGTKVCPSCLEQGFHTVIFSADFLERCPRHGELLVDKCLQCGKTLGDFSLFRSGAVPGLCRCKQDYFSEERARIPFVDSERTAALEDITSWVCGVGNRYWSYLPQQAQVAPGEHRDTLHDHIDRWCSELAVRRPEWLSLNLVAPPSDGLAVRCTERSGLRTPSLARMEGAGGAYLTSTPQELPVEHRLEHVKLFKCVRRYLVKHLLGNRIRLLVWMGSNLSSSSFRKILAESRYAHVAWAILYWMQRTTWGGDHARRWFSRLNGHFHIPHPTYDPTIHWGKPIQEKVVVRPGNGMEAWVVNWLNASVLLDMWPTHKELEKFSSDDGFIEATYRRNRRPPIPWWAWLDADSRLQLGMYRRKPEWHELTAQRSSKGQRRLAHAQETSRREKHVRDAMEGSAWCLHGDGTWELVGKLDIPSGAEIRTGRLDLAPGNRVKFGVLMLPVGKDSGGEPWMIRAFDFPVCVMAASAKAGITRLKAAIQAYCATGQGGPRLHASVGVPS